MTQRDPDPAELPEAMPVLPYERQTDDGMMEWVVRFIGAWVIATAAASLLIYGVQTVLNALSGAFSPYWSQSVATLLGNGAAIAFGIAMIRRVKQARGMRGLRRWQFAARMWRDDPRDMSMWVCDAYAGGRDESADALPILRTATCLRGG